MLVLDTDHLSILQFHESPAAIELARRLDDSGEFDIVTTIISYEEQARSWLGQIRRYSKVHRQIPYYDRLVEFADFFSRWNLLSLDTAAADMFERFRSQRIRISTSDLKIASIALACDAILLSRNLQDFQQVPGLRVENWL